MLGAAFALDVFNGSLVSVAVKNVFGSIVRTFSRTSSTPEQTGEGPAAQASTSPGEFASALHPVLILH